MDGWRRVELVVGGGDEERRRDEKRESGGLWGGCGIMEVRCCCIPGCREHRSNWRKESDWSPPEL